MKHSADLEEMATAAISAAARLLSFDGSHPSIKSDGSLLTMYDTLVETEVVTTLSRLDPTSEIISEELASSDVYDAPAGFRGWVLDPIDGTTNFAAGFPVFAISLAFVDNGVSTFGIVWDSLTRRSYSSSTVVTNTYADCAAESYAACDFEGDERAHRWGIDAFSFLAKSTRSTRVIGSVALGMLWTALGRFDVYCAPAPKVWDYAAGDALVRAAGGIVMRRQLGTGRPSLICGSPTLVAALAETLEHPNERI